ncbi:hypothetical protein YPPY91_3620, partial [Yersinia pestis PY-91]
MSLKL